MEILIGLLILSHIGTWLFLANRYKRNKHLSKITYTLLVGVEQLIQAIETKCDETSKVHLKRIQDELNTLKFYSKSINKTLTDKK